MKVAIAGYGVEGRVSYQYWRKAGHEVTILEERDMSIRELPYGSRSFTGSNAFEDLDEFDMVIRTAGLSPKRLKGAKKIWSATNEFFQQCPAPIIGVTGTKGKGTTASLIASILKAAGKTVHLVGNIGTPALEVLPLVNEDDIVVYELSSFQLWDVEKSPHVAVVLMIEPDHLDVHDDMDDYVNAKANIVRFQSADDITVFNNTNDLSKHIADISHAQRVSYPLQADIDTYRQYIKLPGLHNLDNMSAAIRAVQPFVTDETTIAKGIGSFTGLPHRLKFVREVQGVKYYDDSIATTPGSAIAALRSFEEPKVIILGGSDKGADYESIVLEAKAHDATVLAIGQTGGKIAALCDKHEVAFSRSDATMMHEVVHEASTLAKTGDVVILSPASASFDMFKSYSDRGDQFVAAVEAL